MRYYFDFDERLCSACGACAVACMDLNDIDVRMGDTPYRTVAVTETPGEDKLLHFSSAACRHCSDAACMEVCPAGCFTRDAETGLVFLDSASCLVCGACREACPWHIPAPDSEGRMSKCHGCAVRIKNGLLPACVRNCPTGALTLRKGEM